YTANMAKRARHGRIYVDYLRNGMGATAVAAYSTRARPGAAVSTPLAWDELGPGIRADHFTVLNLPRRLAYLDADPWEGFLSIRQELPGSRNGAGRKRAEPRPAPAPSQEDADEALPEPVAPPKDRLAAYWRKVAPDALAYLARRPLDLL